MELPGWPASKAIEAFAGTELSGPSIKYGNQQAAAADTVQVPPRRFDEAGQLPIRIIEALSEPQRDALVGSYTARTPAARTEALQLKLEQRAIDVRRAVDEEVSTSSSSHPPTPRLC